MPTIDDMRNQFNGLSMSDKREFINQLKEHIGTSDKPEHREFLNECVHKYNADLHVQQTQPSYDTSTSGILPNQNQEPMRQRPQQPTHHKTAQVPQQEPFEQEGKNMFCVKCGNQLTGEQQFCPTCGTRKAESPVYQPQQTYANYQQVPLPNIQYERPLQTTHPVQQRKNLSRKIIAICSIACFAVIISIVLIYSFRDNQVPIGHFESDSGNLRDVYQYIQISDDDADGTVGIFIAHYWDGEFMGGFTYEGDVKRDTLTLTNGVYHYFTPSMERMEKDANEQHMYGFMIKIVDENTIELWSLNRGVGEPYPMVTYTKS